MTSHTCDASMAESAPAMEASAGKAQAGDRAVPLSSTGTSELRTRKNLQRREQTHSGAVSRCEAAIPRSWRQGYAHVQATEPSLTKISVDNKRIQFCL